MEKRAEYITQEAAMLDQESIEELVVAIVSNKRLAWRVVERWLAIHDYILITPGQWRKVQRERGEIREAV
jgi:hypothetical protein